MTTTTPDSDAADTADAGPAAAEQARAAADAAYKTAQAAVDAARAGIAASRQDLAAGEAAAAETLAAALTSGDGAGRATVDKARARVEKLRSDVDWSGVQLQAAELAMSRAADDAARAHRAVIAEEYIEAHRQHNDPSERVNVLEAELPGLIAEFLQLVGARQALHRRLAPGAGVLPCR